MSKTWSTKKRILESLKMKNKTLTDLSEELELAPSTVSQHIEELLRIGAIRSADTYPRKWKYYELNREFNIEEAAVTTRMPIFRRSAVFTMTAIVLALVIIGVLYYTYSRGIFATAPSLYLTAGGTVPAGTTLFSLSDSPSTLNISSVRVTINNVSIHSITNGKWYSIALQTKSFNLIQLRNISQVVAGASLSTGLYDEIALNVSNVIATVNGTSQGVFLPSGDLKIFGMFNISNSVTNRLNIDFDLAHSIHVTGNGKIILLPVLRTTQISNESLQLDQQLKIIVKTQGQIVDDVFFGMNEHGEMQENFTVPQNLSINVSSSGRITGEMEMQHIPIIVSGPRSIAVVLNSSSPNIASTNVRGIMKGNVALVVRNGTSTNSGVFCEIDDGAVHCLSNNTALQLPTIVDRVGVGIGAAVKGNTSTSSNIACIVNSSGVTRCITNSTASPILCCHPYPVASAQAQIGTRPPIPNRYPCRFFCKCPLLGTANTATAQIYQYPCGCWGFQKGIACPLIGNSTINVTGGGGIGAAGGGPTSTIGGGTIGTNGTVTGRVSVGPFCPVEKYPPMAMCLGPATLYSSRQLVFSAVTQPNIGGGGPTSTIAYPRPINVQLNSDGSFSASLLAGSTGTNYSVTLSNCTFLGCRIFPMYLIVKPGAAATLNISVDTGIR